MCRECLRVLAMVRINCGGLVKHSCLNQLVGDLSCNAES